MSDDQPIYIDPSEPPETISDVMDRARQGDLREYVVTDEMRQAWQGRPQTATLAPAPPRVDNLLEIVENSALRAVQRHAQGEQGLALAVSMTVVPDAQPGGFVPVLLIVLTGPGVLVGERTSANLISFNVHPDDAEVDRIVANGLEQMRAQRSEALAMAQAGAGPTV